MVPVDRDETLGYTMSLQFPDRGIKRSVVTGLKGAREKHLDIQDALPLGASLLR